MKRLLSVYVVFKTFLLCMVCNGEIHMCSLLTPAGSASFFIQLHVRGGQYPFMGNSSPWVCNVGWVILFSYKCQAQAEQIRRLIRRSSLLCSTKDCLKVPRLGQVRSRDRKRAHIRENLTTEERRKSWFGTSG